jgi:hypothetical protein
MRIRLPAPSCAKSVAWPAGSVIEASLPPL